MVENKSVANHSAMDWVESIKWSWKPEDSPQRGEEWRRKENVNGEQQQNEQYQHMKIQQQNEDHKMKRTTTTT